MFTSGEQFTIVNGTRRAVITEVGATLRSYSDHGVAIVWEFPESEFSTGGRGQVLCPWPNRLEDGKFTFNGVHATAALDEPARNNAIHGLVRWLAWSVVSHEDSTITLSCVVVPQPAYPFRLRVAITYYLDEHGLTVVTTLANEDERALPVGLGFHPYLVAVDDVDATSLVLPAETHLLVNDRGFPSGRESIANFLSTRGLERLATDQSIALSLVVLDDCFTDLAVDDGRWRVGFHRGDGDLVTLWGDAAFSHLMCYTGDTLDKGLRRRGVAIEPMTCPPNALASGTDCIVIEAGKSYRCAWGISGLMRAPSTS